MRSLPALPPGFAECIERLAPLHSHLCPRQVLAVRMGLYASEVLGLALPQKDKRLLAFVETDGCFADGIAVTTGCTIGRRTLRVVDYGKVAATFVDTETSTTVRLRPDPEARERAAAYSLSAVSGWHAQLDAYGVMPSRELLQMELVTLSVPAAAIVSRPGLRVVCAQCGEEIMNGREVLVALRPLCRACSGERYYRAADAVSRPSNRGIVTTPPETLTLNW